MEARRLRNKMEKGRGSVRLKFWQKTYLLTLALFLLALGGGTTAIASVSQQRAFEAECGKLLAQQHSVAQSLAADAAAVQALSLIHISLCETAGQFAYVFAIGANAIVAAPMISSYCIMSLVWSRIFLKEKLSKAQYAVIAVAAVGIAILGME